MVQSKCSGEDDYDDDDNDDGIEMEEERKHFKFQK